MIKNYFIVALRNFWRNKVFSLINVLGLSIGISAALVIFLIVHYEYSYDRFEKDGDRIYRVVLDAKFNGQEGHSSAVPAPLANAIQNEVAGVDETVPVMTFQGDATAKVTVTNNGGKEVVFKKQQDVVFTNSQYFQMLPFKWVVGSQQTSLRDPFKVVLSESRAQLYFPDVAAVDVIGRNITYNDVTVTVSGIVKDLKEHTSFNAAEFISYPTIAKTALQDQFMMNVWNDWMAYSTLYLKISKGNTAANAETQVNTLLKKYNKEAHKDDNNYMSFHLQPLNDIHFNSTYSGFGQRIASRTTLYGLLAIAAFLLLLGCINFINLTTAQATHRAKEIGIRKTLGASVSQVWLLLSKDFIVLVIISCIIASPVAFYFLHEWLQKYNYRINISGRVFIASAILAIVITIITISFQAIKAALADPVKSLRTE